LPQFSFRWNSVAISKFLSEEKSNAVRQRAIVQHLTRSFDEEQNACGMVKHELSDEQLEQRPNGAEKSTRRRIA
jgi:hypothetical protein